MTGGLMAVLAVGAGGFVGATLRYGAVVGVELLLARREGLVWPFATLLVNVLGSCALGYLLHRLEALPPEQRLFLATGVLGAFTTFSTFSVEALALWREGRAAAALVYVAISVLASIAAAWLGWRLGAPAS